LSEILEARFGLPREVRFCRRCVMSNQRPCSSVEFKHTPDQRHRTLHFDDEGVCDACRYAEQKDRIDWKQREEQLLGLLDRHRRNDGHYDCIAPGSGGKDSVYAAHLLKYKYGMHPLTVTWPPILYTDIGLKNFRNWLYVGGFDNLSFNYNARNHALLTRLAIENLLHPFQPFILGQKNLAPKIALRYKIPLIFYGENEAEYGNPVSDNAASLRDKSYHTMKGFNDLTISGVSVPRLMEEYKLTLNDILTYLPAQAEDFEGENIEVHYLGYYLKWTPQEAYYYSVEHSGFQANPVRTEGTFTKYSSLDDRIDGFHYYTTFIKFGIGRATYDASHEIRNRHITRDEGVVLVCRFDGEFPKKYFQEVMDYIGMKPERFMELCDQFRSPHLWQKEGDGWTLRHRVS
jgi:N-acetyl sugar amidotransferase